MPTAALICSACGARNKEKWQFCARCGESLEGAQAQEAGDTEATIQTYLDDDIDDDLEPPAEAMPSWLVVLVGVAALAGLGVGTWRHVKNTPPTTLSSSVFAFPTAVPPRPVLPPTPGLSRAAEAHQAGRRLLAQGDAVGAVALLAEAASLDSENAEYLNSYGEGLLAVGARDSALVQFSLAARISPDRYAVPYARALDIAQRKTEAVAVYEDILRRQPTNALAQESLGRLLYRMKDFQRAAAYLQAGVSARPEDSVLRQEMAFALDKAGQTAAAEEAYRTILGRLPGAEFTRGLLADNLQRQGRTDEAIALLTEGLRETPNAPLLHRGLGSLFERTGRLTDAAREYMEYARLAPNTPDSRSISERAAALSAPDNGPSGL
jgi:tetratricopeptide (TPR) repeat protein